MSQSILDRDTDTGHPSDSGNGMTTEDVAAATASDAPTTARQLRSADLQAFEEFNYRPVPIMAPVTLFLGVSSSIALFGLTGIFVALAGCVCGVICLRQIQKAKGDLGGWWLGVTGLTLSAILLLGGSTLQAYSYATEVPEGYERVNFSDQIAKKGFVFQDGKTGIHPDVQALEGKQIFLKGYMYPTRESEGLTSFLLVKDNQQCCFGGQPQVTDMIMVQLPTSQAADYTQSLVSVAGTFRISPSEGPANLTPIYLLDGTHFSRARNSF
ncbi:MAG: hypothetical protein KDA79_12010 [Planctomycetaceae bacterium]|nr:hypothetical protein [Planctomycetaceae bacterium]